MEIQGLVQEIIKGRRLTREDDLSFFRTISLKDLCQGADNIREELCGNSIDLCSIINGKGGRCSEDCKKHADQKVHRYSIVTAGRDLNEKELKEVCLAYKVMHEGTACS